MTYALYAVQGAPSHTRACALDGSGKEVCGIIPIPSIRNHPKIPDRIPSRDSSQGDYSSSFCDSSVAVRLLAGDRTRSGLPFVPKHGSSAMFHDALQHSRRMSRASSLLLTDSEYDKPRVVDCGIAVGRYKVAVFDGIHGSYSTNMCSQAFKHFQTIYSDRSIRSMHDFEVVAAYASNGKTWCTHSIAVSTNYNDLSDNLSDAAGDCITSDLPLSAKPPSQYRETSRNKVALRMGSKLSYSKFGKHNFRSIGSMGHNTARYRGSKPMTGGKDWQASRPRLNLHGDKIPVPRCDIREMAIASRSDFIVGSDCSVKASSTSSTQKVIYDMVMTSSTLRSMLRACGVVSQCTLTSDRGALAAFAGYFRMPPVRDEILPSWKALFAHEVAHACLKIGHSPQQDSLVASCLCEWRLSHAHYITQSSPGILKKLTCTMCDLDC